MLLKTSKPEKFCFTAKASVTCNSLASDDPKYVTLPLELISKGVSTPETPPNKLFPKVSFWLATFNISNLII